MDVQETKDGQFVMMHDANLEALGRRLSAGPARADSARADGFRCFKTGHTAKISSFDAYLKRANQMGQRLLTEIRD